jgi:hypothetical protein
MRPVRRIATLETPPLPRLAPDGVFDAFGWCASDRLGWGRPAARPLDVEADVTSDNPPGMVFVMRRETPFLPRELAELHAPGMGLEGAWALAPWGIDEATDALYAHRATPGEHLWLAASSVASLFWGLHDWAHFHNHGPFERRAWTELQCDVSALAWLEVNRAVLAEAGVTAPVRERVRREAARVATQRFAEEASEIEPFDATLYGADRIRAIAHGIAPRQMD